GDGLLHVESLAEDDGRHGSVTRRRQGSPWRAGYPSIVAGEPYFTERFNATCVARGVMESMTANAGRFSESKSMSSNDASMGPASAGASAVGCTCGAACCAV